MDQGLGTTRLLALWSQWPNQLNWLTSGSVWFGLPSTKFHLAWNPNLHWIETTDTANVTPLPFKGLGQRLLKWSSWSFQQSLPKPWHREEFCIWNLWDCSQQIFLINSKPGGEFCIRHPQVSWLYLPCFKDHAWSWHIQKIPVNGNF